MKKKILHFYRPVLLGQTEICFNVETAAPLDDEEMRKLKWLLAETFEAHRLSEETSLCVNNSNDEVTEIGPRLNFATPFNTNALSILKSCGFGDKITRLEVSRRHIHPAINWSVSFDRMTEGIYSAPLSTFETGQKPATVYSVPLIEHGLAAFNDLEGLSMDESDKRAYYDYFVGRLHRNPTIVEIMDLNNANSEHSRHGYFKGRQIIDGQEMPETLMEIVKSTLSVNPRNSLVAFRDNSSVIKGYNIWVLMPEKPGQASRFIKRQVTYHILFTAETHNFPTGIAPFPGAQTGTGGRIRDVQATGRGGLMLAGTAGYAVGNLFLDNYPLPWEKPAVYPTTLASAKDILIFGSNGTSRYGNEIGEPVIQGFLRVGASYLPDGTRQEFLKPILFTGGIGQIDDRHLEKQDAQSGQLIVQIGGPAYRIGFGGGSASSLMQGDNKEELDFNAVQRGDAEMEQKVNRVVRACIEMGANNPIISIHDQGAGGPANVLKELVEKAGGSIDIRKINSGDPTLSVLELWVCEYQERNGLLISPERIDEFSAICDREHVNCEVLGQVTGNGIFTVHDSLDGSIPVHLDLAAVLGDMPQKTFKSETIKLGLKPLQLPANLKILKALHRVLRLPAVGSKRFLTNKVDRSVTGLIAQQQCCGPLHLPVADVAVVSQSYLPNDSGCYSGAATAIGEQPIKMLVNPAAGARMAVAEMLTNMASAFISDINNIKCSANWMGAPKLPGEGARMYEAAVAVRDLMFNIGIAIDGGKDSLSMATKVKHLDGSVETVKSPLELVISGYCTVPDVTKVMTPDIKHPGQSRIMRLDLASGRRRLGGSALAQVYGQLGNECPDIENAALLVDGFECLQDLIMSGLICSCHDISDGGMIVSLLEMAFAGNCGFEGQINTERGREFPELFAEEAGWLIEYLPDNEDNVISVLKDFDIPYQIISKTTIKSEIKLDFLYPGNEREIVIESPMAALRFAWEQTSSNLELLQCERECVEAESKSIFVANNPPYSLSFTPQMFTNTDSCLAKPKVAILRTKGSNGDREMAAYFKRAGFETMDVDMDDLLKEKFDLSTFRGVAFVGGFSFADALDSAKGWAATILFNEKVKKVFDDFYRRPDTFSLSVCNGCQLAALIGWVPGVDSDYGVRFIKNNSERFESRFSTVKILESPAIMLKDMAGSTLGIWSAHGEGLLHAAPGLISYIEGKNLAPIRFVDDNGHETEKYPFNPNGSLAGITGICDPTGRHLAMMPHPERTFLKWQLPYMPNDWQENLQASPWLKMTQNAYQWCLEN